MEQRIGLRVSRGNERFVRQLCAKNTVEFCGRISSKKSLFMALFDTRSHRDFSCREMRQIFIYHNRLFINGLWLNPVFCTDATQRPDTRRTLAQTSHVLCNILAVYGGIGRKSREGFQSNEPLPKTPQSGSMPPTRPPRQTWTSDNGHYVTLGGVRSCAWPSSLPSIVCQSLVHAVRFSRRRGTHVA